MKSVMMSVSSQVWRVENMELAEVDANLHGYFYGGDCYLILYTYEVNGKKNYILYMWLVKNFIYIYNIHQ